MLTARACNNRQRYQTDGLPCWREENLISTQLRLAAGICVLSTGLLIGSAGGAIASADDSATAAQGQTVDAAAAATTSTTNDSAEAAPATQGSALQQKVTALLRKLREDQSRLTKRLVATSQAMATGDVKKEAELTEAPGTPLASDTTEDGSESTDVALGADVSAESTDPMTPASTVVKPVTNAVVTVMGVMGTVPGVVAALPNSDTPIIDVIASLEDMLTSVTDAVLPLASVPSDLYTMLAATSVPTATVGGGAGFSVGPVVAEAPLLPSVMPAWPPVVPNTDLWAAYGDASAPATIGDNATAGLSQELSISGAAPLATESVIPAGVLPMLEHAVSALLVPASLSALAALALPGVAGLLFVCAVGIRFGYRQAKAGLMLRATGLMRFAGAGPLGVVRSGGLIALRHRAEHGVRPPISAIGHQVA